MLGPGEDNCDITGILYQIIKSGSMVAGSIELTGWYFILVYIQ